MLFYLHTNVNGNYAILRCNCITLEDNKLSMTNTYLKKMKHIEEMKAQSYIHISNAKKNEKEKITITNHVSLHY